MFVELLINNIVGNLGLKWVWIFINLFGFEFFWFEIFVIVFICLILDKFEVCLKVEYILVVNL